jgi:hypothetical protein
MSITHKTGRSWNRCGKGGEGQKAVRHEAEGDVGRASTEQYLRMENSKLEDIIIRWIYKYMMED